MDGIKVRIGKQILAWNDFAFAAMRMSFAKTTYGYGTLSVKRMAFRSNTSTAAGRFLPGT